MKLEKVAILTPKLLGKWVFEEKQSLKLVRPKNTNRITVAGDDFQHSWMGIPGEKVASAATICDTFDVDPAMMYTLGGSSFNTENPRYIFLETEGERVITLAILGVMLKKIGRSGITVFDPSK